MTKKLAINEDITLEKSGITFEKLVNQQLSFKDMGVYKNVNYNDLTVGIYKMNTWTGVGGSNYPADNLLGSLIVLENVQIAISTGCIYVRAKVDNWGSWVRIS